MARVSTDKQEYERQINELSDYAKSKGIKAEGGLYMLVMQAVVAVEKFLDTEISRTVADNVFASVLASKENIVLTGMPGSGKSTVGKLLNIDGFTFVDTDEEIEKRLNIWQDLGYKVLRISAKTGEGMPEFASLLEGKLSALSSSTLTRICGGANSSIFTSLNPKHFWVPGMKALITQTPLG